jgi:transcriptional regulator with XRE-family HTH domain
MTALGDKIAHHRKRLGMTFQGLADKANLAEELVLRIEGAGMDGSGVATLRVGTLASLARALGVSPLLLAAAAFEDLAAGEDS